MDLRWWRVALIAVFGGVLGLSWNSLSGRGFALDRNVLIQEGDQIVEAPEAKKRLDAGALFLDARPQAFYDMSHIPGALPLPEDDFERAFARVEPTLRKSFDIVVYCSGFGCEASHIVARKLKERGIPAAILHDGIPAWQERQYPLREGPQP
jgi:rhodanese-related sulfurtransferase